MKAIAWKDVPVGSFITTKRDMGLPPDSRRIWEKIDSDDYYNCENVADGNQSKVSDPEWECYLCDINGNLIEEKIVTQKTIKFRDIKVGEYFKSGKWFYQKCDTCLKDMQYNAICLNTDPNPRIVGFHNYDDVVKCDKDGNIPEVWKTFDEMEYGEYYEYDNGVGLRIMDDVLILKSIYNSNKMYTLGRHQIDRSIKRKIIDRPDDVKLP